MNIINKIYLARRQSHRQMVFKLVLNKKNCRYTVAKML